MKRRTLLRSGLAATGGLTAMALVGCGDDDDGDDASPTATSGSGGGDPTATSAPEATATSAPTGPSGTLRIAVSDLGNDSLDAHFARSPANTVTFYPIYSTLTNWDMDRNDVGEVAESWEVAEPDHMTWTWKLKPGIVDHQGNPMDAETVAWNILHGIEISPTSLTGRFYESHEVIDDTTLTIKTNGPFVAGAQHAAGFGEIRLYSMRAFEEMGEDAFYRSPVGSGPFMFDSRVPGQEMNYKAFPDYFDGAPGVERLEFHIVAEQATRIAQLQTGDADMISAVAGTIVDQLEGSDDIELKRIEDSSWMILSPFDRLDPDSALHDPKVMAALNHAVDKEGIVEGIYRGRGKPAPYGFFSPITTGFHEDYETWDYDPAKAKALLAEAGYEDGFTMGDMYVTDLAAFPLASATIEAVGNNLRDIGVQAGFRNIDYAAYIDSVRNGEARGLIYLASAALPDVSLGLPVWVNSASPFAPFPDGKLDALVLAQATEFDEEARQGLLEQIFDGLNKDPMVVFTVAPDSYLARSNKVSDWPQPRATAYLQKLQHVTVEA